MSLLLTPRHANRFRIIPSEAFDAKLIEEVYATSADEVSIRRLALLFSFLAVGSFADADQMPHTKEAECYHLHAKLALCEGSIISDPDVTVVQCLVGPYSR